MISKIKTLVLVLFFLILPNTFAVTPLSSKSEDILPAEFKDSNETVYKNRINYVIRLLEESLDEIRIDKIKEHVQQCLRNLQEDATDEEDEEERTWTTKAVLDDLERGDTKSFVASYKSTFDDIINTTHTEKIYKYVEKITAYRDHQHKINRDNFNAAHCNEKIENISDCCSYKWLFQDTQLADIIFSQKNFAVFYMEAQFCRLAKGKTPTQILKMIFDTEDQNYILLDSYNRYIVDNTRNNFLYHISKHFEKSPEILRISKIPNMIFVRADLPHSSVEYTKEGRYTATVIAQEVIKNFIKVINDDELEIKFEKGGVLIQGKLTKPNTKSSSFPNFNGVINASDKFKSTFNIEATGYINPQHKFYEKYTSRIPAGSTKVFEDTDTVKTELVSTEIERPEGTITYFLKTIENIIYFQLLLKFNISAAIATNIETSNGYSGTFVPHYN